MDTSIIGIGIALGVSLFILYTRKMKWMPERIVWLICSVLLAFGLFGLLDSKTEFENDRVMYLGFCIPIIYWIFDRIFKLISLKIHKRDFILFLRNSNEINSDFGLNDHHIKGSDKLFSFALLIIIIVSLLTGIQIIC